MAGSGSRQVRLVLESGVTTRGEDMARRAETGKAPGPGRLSSHPRRRATRRRDAEPPTRDADPRHAAGWIRDDAEPVDRRPADIALLVVAVVGVAVAGVWAQAAARQNGIRTVIFIEGCLS